MNRHAGSCRGLEKPASARLATVGFGEVNLVGAHNGRVAVVTGASRGIGKGIARALGEQGATVYVTGRTTGDGERSIDTTARMVTEAGGEGRAIRCDHGDDEAIAKLFAQVGDEAGRIDFLINNVYKIPDPPAWGGGFWDHPIQIWTIRWALACAPTMWPVGTPRRCCSRGHRAPPSSTSPPAVARNTTFPAPTATGKAGLDRLTADMALELKPKGVAAVALYPGSVSTEFIQEVAAARGMDLSKSQTPLFVGRSVAALLASEGLLSRTGSIQWVEDLAEEFDLVDEHGRWPPGHAERN